MDALVAQSDGNRQGSRCRAAMSAIVATERNLEVRACQVSSPEVLRVCEFAHCPR